MAFKYIYITAYPEYMLPQSRQVSVHDQWHLWAAGINPRSTPDINTTCLHGIGASLDINHPVNVRRIKDRRWPLQTSIPAYQGHIGTRGHTAQRQNKCVRGNTRPCDDAIAPARFISNDPRSSMLELGLDNWPGTTEVIHNIRQMIIYT